MPMPILIKTWQHLYSGATPTTNILVSTTTQTLRNQTVLHTIKEIMKGVALGAWTCVGSSDSVAAGLDAVDRWAAPTNLVWSVGAHSWIVLKQTGIGPNFQLCFDLNTGVPGDLVDCVASPSAGFTGGTTSARPTATDEFSIRSGAWTYTSANDPIYLHGMVSTDGQCSRFFLCRANLVCGMMLFEVPRFPVGGWSQPFMGFVAGGGGSTNVPSYVAGLFDNINGWPVLNATSRGRANGGGFRLLWATRAVRSGIPFGYQVLTVPHDITGEMSLGAIALYSDQALVRGRHGMLFDAWAGSSQLGMGETYPADLTRQLVQFRDLVVPWDGSVPKTAA